MKIFLTRWAACLGGVLLVTLLPLLAVAQDEVVTTPVGYHTVTIKGGADNFFSMPFPADASDMGAVSAVDATSITDTNVSWTANQWQYNTSSGLTYYVQFKSGALLGVFYTVTSNTANQIFLDTQGDYLTNCPPLGAVTNGDTYEVIAYWRIKDLFLGTNGTGTFLEGRANKFVPKDDINVYPSVTIGKNKSPLGAYYFLNASNAWYQWGSSSTTAGDTIVPPGSAVQVRRRNTNDLDVVLSGRIILTNQVVFMRSGTNTVENDNFVSITFPVPVSLANSGLTNNGAFRISANQFAMQDQILEFPSPSGFNQSPVSTYFFLTNATQNGWRKWGGGSADYGTNTFLQPGKAYVIRKKAAAADVDWVQAPGF